ncbi:echinoderm microtubule-associated protein-like 1 isoform X5 [Arapaima gigas]
MEDGFSSYSSLYDTSSLLQFCNDDSASAASSMEVTDRIASLEQRVQMQEDEIQLLKSALADVVRRLNISEEQQAMVNRKGPTKGNKIHLYLLIQTHSHFLFLKPLNQCCKYKGSKQNVLHFYCENDG